MPERHSEPQHKQTRLSPDRQKTLTVLPLGLHEVWHGFLSRLFCWSRSLWKALMWWLVKGCRPSLSRTRHRAAFSQFLYSLSLRRVARSWRAIVGLASWKDRKEISARSSAPSLLVTEKPPDGDVYLNNPSDMAVWCCCLEDKGVPMVAERLTVSLQSWGMSTHSDTFVPENFNFVFSF